MQSNKKWIKNEGGFRTLTEAGKVIVCCYCEVGSVAKEKITNRRREFEKKIKEGVSHGMCKNCFINKKNLI